MAKKIAVIGSGASGLAAIKCCLDEKLEPVCFERTDNIGGLWRYTEEVRDGQSCVMRSTVINTSKEMMCYSDYPIPKEYPIYMHNTQVWEYFKQYANEFNLRKCIRFETEVVSVKRSADFDETGRWDIQVKDLNTGETQDLVFDGVLVCTGHHAVKNEPVFTGMDEFEGKIVHSHDYRDFHGYEDKRVVVVGIGNSGGDATVELSRIASQVFLSTRRGSWIMNRVSDNGLPGDMNLFNRLAVLMLQKLPLSIINGLITGILNKRFDHAAYSIKPEHPPFAQHPTVNDDLPNRIICGSVKVKTDIKRLTKNGVEFIDGTKEDNIDAIITATGYKFGFPFLEKSVVDVKDNRVELFKYMFPPDLKKQTIAIIGCIQPLGAIMPISELQCRLATRVFKGDVQLPSKEDMWKDVRDKEIRMIQRYVQSTRHTIQVDYCAFMDELADLNGCRIDFKRLLKSDPKLALTCYLGPVTPYQYRLFGPGKWPKAKEAINTAWERTFYPLKTRPVKAENKFSLMFYVMLAVAVLILAYIFL
ncbi:flavin-containing monooxygenase 5-like [Patella vulgata]|uniref:flavin-containing monooxygenase 5-like n=1 Tax=Patella vulgata TaxID=6465 RepID=UPI0021807F35|nr:flavin-containing monooxygenase 5-like [Patella vulgata]XP_050404536.1 flavin-containing monooxygenase 5-like [Patella vulgata]XP_055958080.1 flavin-containing monooxygenase 5-like [Patella vulgata]